MFQAFEFYNRALRCLADRKKNPEVWDTVTWELSGSYFTMATLLQDFAPLSTYAQEQVTRKLLYQKRTRGLLICKHSKISIIPRQTTEAVNHVACFRPSNVGRRSKVKNWEQNTALPFSLIYFISLLYISYFLSILKQRKYQSSNTVYDFLCYFFFINRLRKKLPS